MQLTNDICVYEKFIEMIVHKCDNYKCVYTDGSKCPVINSVSSAVFVACSGLLVSCIPGNWIQGILFFWSELYAIQRAIEITNSMHELHFKNIVILTDSRTACMLLLSPTGTYCSTIENIRSLLVKCNNKKSVKIQWINAHAGIKGNELADRGVKDAHQKSDITMFSLCV